MPIKKDTVRVKRLYLLTLTSYEDKLGGVEKLIQNETTLYFKTSFQF
jgi:hypothetical protein